MADIVPFPVEPVSAQTILVVDDEPAIRGILCEFLQECGFRPLAAEDADQAIRILCQSAPVDLVFSDVRMPGTRDGYGLARWIIENRPKLPFILVTGDLGKANAAAGLTGKELAGVETFAKPYDFDAAVRKIRDTIRRRKIA